MSEQFSKTQSNIQYFPAQNHLEKYQQANEALHYLTLTYLLMLIFYSTPNIPQAFGITCNSS